MWKSELVRESTKQGNDKVARQMEAAHRTSLAKGEVGIREKRHAPTLSEFCEKRFEPSSMGTTHPVGCKCLASTAKWDVWNGLGPQNPLVLALLMVPRNICFWAA